jgi:hypothetical protein
MISFGAQLLGITPLKKTAKHNQKLFLKGREFLIIQNKFEFAKFFYIKHNKNSMLTLKNSFWVAKNYRKIDSCSIFLAQGVKRMLGFY